MPRTTARKVFGIVFSVIFFGLFLYCIFHAVGDAKRRAAEDDAMIASYRSWLESEYNVDLNNDGSPEGAIGSRKLKKYGDSGWDLSVIAPSDKGSGKNSKKGSSGNGSSDGSGRSSSDSPDKSNSTWDNITDNDGGWFMDQITNGFN